MLARDEQENRNNYLPGAMPGFFISWSTLCERLFSTRHFVNVTKYHHGFIGGKLIHKALKGKNILETASYNIFRRLAQRLMISIALNALPIHGLIMTIRPIRWKE